MPDKLGTRIRYSFRFTAQGCFDAGGEDAVDPPVRRALRSGACSVSVAMRRGLSIFDKPKFPLVGRV